jgi:hypothetical protein
MRHGIVEGEPGIFPDPISRIMRKIGGFFDRRKDDPEPTSDETADTPSTPPDEPAQAADDKPSSPPEPEQSSDDTAAGSKPSSPPEKP